MVYILLILATDVSHTLCLLSFKHGQRTNGYLGSLGFNALLHKDGVPGRKSLVQFTLSLKLFIPTDVIRTEDRISRSETQQGAAAAMANI